MRVEVYIKSGCQLCDEALDALREAGVSFSVHDIRTRKEWFQAYRYLVPMLCVEGRALLTLRWSVDDVRRVLRCE